MESYAPLGTNRILSALSVSDLAEMKPMLRQVALVHGSVLHHPGELVEFIHFPLSGMISKLVVMRTGQQIETGFVGRSGVAGGSIATRGPRAFGQSTVQIAGNALQVAASQFLAMFNKSAELQKLINEFEGFMYFQAQQSAACHAVHTVEARLCRWLLQSKDTLQSPVIALTQEFLSHMLGVQRNAVSLCAHSLQEAGLIRYSRGVTTIVDRDGLKNSACECYEATREYSAHMLPPM